MLIMTPDNQWAVLQLPFPSSDESYSPDDFPFRIGDYGRWNSQTQTPLTASSTRTSRRDA